MEYISQELKINPKEIMAFGDSGNDYKMLKLPNEKMLKWDIIMKFAILTDVHGNFDALDTVLDDIDRREGINKIFNL